MIKTTLCLTALLIPLAGCMGNATVSTRDADRGTTVRRAEESASIDGWRIFYRVNEADQVITVIAVKRRERNTYTYLYSLFL